MIDNKTIQDMQGEELLATVVALQDMERAGLDTSILIDDV